MTRRLQNALIKSFLILLVLAAALHLSLSYRYAHVPLRSAIIPRGMPQLGQAVQGLAFSPDGRKLAVADTQTGMSLWFLPSLRCDRRVENSIGDRESALYWTPDGNTLATGDTGSIYRWNVADGGFWPILTRQISVMGTPASNRNWFGWQTYVVSPLGRLAAGADVVGNVSVWNIQTGRVLFSVKALPGGPNGYPTDFCDVAFSPDDRFVAFTALTGDNSVAYAPLDIVIRNTQTGYVIHQWQWKNAAYSKTDDSSGGNLTDTGLLFSPDGKMLATADGNGAALWNASTGRLIRTLEPVSTPWSGSKKMVFFAGSRFVAGCGWGDQVPVWNVHTGRLVQTFYADEFTQAVAVSPNNQILATGGETGSANGRIELWDISKLKP